MSCSTLRTSNEDSLVSVIVDLILLLKSLSLEKERSTEQVVTGKVRQILYSSVTFGYASCKLFRFNSCNTSLTDSQSVIS